MKFSVLLSVYNQEKSSRLDECLKSIVIEQTLKPNEVVIIKDGKLDNELSTVLKKYQKKYKNIKIYGWKENKGLGLALKFGVEKCSYNLIFRMDSDDISHKLRFKKQIDYLKENPDVKIIGTNAFEFENSKENIKYKRIFPQSSREIKIFSKKRCPFLHPTVAFYKDIVLEVGGYRDLKYFEDYDLFLRILKKYEGANLQEELLYFRSTNETYMRRGGVKYLFNEIKSLKKFRNENLFSTYEMMQAILLRSIFRITTPKFRKLIYQKFLREKN